MLVPRHHAQTSKGTEGRGGWKQRAKKTICVECVSELLPNTESLANLAAGVLAVPLGQAAGGFLVWFRPEFRNTVTYAGVPPDASETAVMRYMYIYMCTYMYYIYLCMSRRTRRRRR